jgi:molybdopterin converting factor small subunit
MTIALPTPSITILYFAAASSATQRSSESIPLPGGKPLALSDLGALLTSWHGDSNLGEVLKTSQWSVDAEMVEDERVKDVVLKGGEEVAVICPVSGG